jgi:hypothetical protein
MKELSCCKTLRLCARDNILKLVKQSGRSRFVQHKEAWGQTFILSILGVYSTTVKEKYTLRDEF